jgi:hypothetical protein
MVYNLVIKIPAIAANIGLAYLVAGPLADNVFEPLLEEDGGLSSTTAAGVVGAGAGRGIALIFIISALSLGISSAHAFANPRIRNLEEEIPDAIPDEPGEDEKQPVMQTSSG